MIDQIYSWRANKANRHPDGDYDPEQAILAERLQNEDSSQLAVVFPPWHGGGKYIEMLTKRLANKGSAVLDFDFHDRVLEPDIERVVQSYRFIREAATTRIQELVEKRGYESVRLIGLSLGNAAMAMVAGELNDFDRASVVTGASDLARPIWEGTSSQQIVRDLMNQGLTIDELGAAWQDLAPMTHAEAFRDKVVQVILATHDRIIPTVYQKELLRGLDDTGARTNPTHLPMGHYATTALFYYFGR